MAKKIININRHILAANLKTGEQKPAISCKTWLTNQYGKSVEILDKDGNVVARVIQNSEKPLNCGATAWVEAYGEVRVIE